MSSWGPWIKGWVLVMLDGKPIPPINRALLKKNLNNEVECPLLEGDAKKLVVCTSASRVLGRMEVTDGDVFITIYLTPYAQHKVGIEDDYDLATLSGTLIRLDKWIFSSVIMAALAKQRNDQTIPLCIQAHAISVIGRDDTDFMMHGRRIININEDKMVKERLGWMTHGMLISKIETCQNLQTGLPNCEGHGTFHAAPYEPLDIGEANREWLRQQCPPPQRNELKDLQDRGACEDEYNTQEPYESICPSHEDLGIGGSQPETQLNNTPPPRNQSKEIVSDQERAAASQPSTLQRSSDEFLVAQYLAQSIRTPPRSEHNSPNGGINDSMTKRKENALNLGMLLGAQDEGILPTQQPFEDSQIMRSSDKGKRIEQSPTGRFSISSLESVPSPNDNSHDPNTKRWHAFSEKLDDPFSGTVTTPLEPQTNVSACKFSSLSGSSDGGVTASALRPVPEEEPSLTWERAATSEQQQQQQKCEVSMNQGHMATHNTPGAVGEGTKRCQDGYETLIHHDPPITFERKAISYKTKCDSPTSSSMNFLVSAFLAGPGAMLRPERSHNDVVEDIQSSTTSLLSNSDGKPLTNNSAIARFVNPSLWRKADNPTSGMMAEEIDNNYVPIFALVKKDLQKQFLSRHTGLPDPRTKLQLVDGSKFGCLHNWFERPPVVEDSIYNSIYRLGLSDPTIQPTMMMAE